MSVQGTDTERVCVCEWGGYMPPALCINLNLLVCLVGKLRVSSRGGRVFAPGLRYMEAEEGVHCLALYTSFVPPPGLDFCRAVRRGRQRVSLYTFYVRLRKRRAIKFKGESVQRPLCWDDEG